jgi:hypothetical protein
MLVQIWYLQHQSTKHKISCSFYLLVLGQSHQAILVAIAPFCYNHKMIKKDKEEQNIL